jgi:uncharacterized protein involved in exopolysaccharide biosynthesis
VHRSAGAFDFVSQQTDQVGSRLDQTEDALKALKTKVGIVSLKDGMSALSDELTKTQDQLHSAEADLAEQRARVLEMHLPLPATTSAPVNKDRSNPEVKSVSAATATPAASPTATASDRVVQQYQLVVSRLAQLRQSRLDLLKKYTPGSVMVQVTQSQIDDLENERKAMEKKNADLPSHVEGGKSGSLGDAVTEPARLAGLEGRTQELRARLADVQARMKKLTDMAPEIGDLERKKEMEETNYKYFATTLEKARVDGPWIRRRYRISVRCSVHHRRSSHDNAQQNRPRTRRRWNSPGDRAGSAPRFDSQSRRQATSQRGSVAYLTYAFHS